MIIKDENLFNKAREIIKSLYGETAEFRDGQYEAIEATLLNKRTLVVQKTGWGKSLVYFACTKILREQNKRITIVVSPLLVLMNNQLEAAKKLNLKCDVLNSTVKDRRKEILSNLSNNELDLLLITPESLFKQDFQELLSNINIGLFVIDEAHCISDWGHDFRLEYGNLYKVLKILPSNVPVLATTATANDRVVNDLKRQLGDKVYISRGSLTRNSLSIQILKLKNKAERYAWILENISHLPGSGIIYCLTQRDCDYLANFLNEYGIESKTFYSGNENKELENSEAITLFEQNKIKVIVATIKLGMGFDKDDIGFVIHYQQPANIVSYYQQIGRAGRNIDNAFIFLMTGKEDEEILDYFIETAFPSKEEANSIIEILKNENGLSIPSMQARVNIRKSRTEKTLNFLENEGYARKEGSKYYLNPKVFVYNSAHYNEVLEIRKKEKAQMFELANTDICYSKFIVSALDDKTAYNCGKCSNCIKEELFPSKIKFENIKKAQTYINNLIIPINPKKRWAITATTRQTKIEYINEVGVCLSKYGDIGYGELVKRDKSSKDKIFCDELVGKSVEVLNSIINQNKIKYITCVPSLRSKIVEDFAERLAKSCNIEFVDLLIKTNNQQQKSMENSSHQCENALKSYEINENAKLFIPESVILVDDIVDSGWTMTICGYKLMENGCKKVIPFALADASHKEG